MTNPTIQTDIAEIFLEIKQQLQSIDSRLNRIEVSQVKLEGKIDSVEEKLSGQIKIVDEKLSGKIETLDQKLSGQIETLDEKVSGQKEVAEQITTQLDKRINNQELLNRVIGGSLVVSIIGGIISFFWMASKIS